MPDVTRYLTWRPHRSRDDTDAYIAQCLAMPPAAARVTRWGLRRDGMFRISGVCDVENIGSARVMEKAGLVREGLARRLIIHPNISDEPRDCFSYAIVR